MQKQSLEVPASRGATSTAPFDGVTIHLRRPGQSKDPATFSPTMCVCLCQRACCFVQFRVLRFSCSAMKSACRCVSGCRDRTHTPTHTHTQRELYCCVRWLQAVAAEARRKPTEPLIFYRKKTPERRRRNEGQTLHECPQCTYVVKLLSPLLSFLLSISIALFMPACAEFCCLLRSALVF